MPRVHRHGDLQIDEDPKFTRRFWKVERVGWVAMAAFVAAGVLGLLGPGPFARATASDPDGRMTVEYERFGHLDTESRLRVHLRPASGSKGVAVVWLEQSYLNDLKVEKVTPEPTAVRTESDRTTYAFLAGEAPHDLTVTFDFSFRRIGRVNARVGSPDAGVLPFRHFVYP